MVVKQLLKELKVFGKKPNINLKETKLSINPIKLFFILFGIDLIIGFFILSILTGAIRIIFHINFSQIDIPIYHMLIANIIFIPIFEEVAFRLPLKFNKWNISLSMFVITLIVSSYFYNIALININNFIYQRLLISLFVFISIFVLLSNSLIYKKIDNFILRNYKLFFYTLLLLFTLRHIDNYQINITTLLFMPILLLPQLLGGFFMAYTRLKINFVSAIIFHFLVNLIAFLPQLYF